MRFRFAGFILDATERRLLDPRGNQVSCAPKTLDALRLLAEKGGQLVSRDDFHEQLWPRSVVADETLAKLIWQVRKALEPVGEELIETVPRHGYRLRAEVAVEAIGSIGLPAAAELPPSVSTSVEVAAATPAAPARHRTKSPLLVPIGATLVVLVVLAALGERALRQDSPPPQAAQAGRVPVVEIAAVATADSSPGIEPWVGETLAAALGLELGLEVVPERAARIDLPEAGKPSNLLNHRVSVDDAGRWLWDIQAGREGPRLSFVIDPQADARSQIRVVANRLRAETGASTPGSARGIARDLALPRSWSSLRAYVDASAALMRRQGRHASDLLAPVVVGEPGFVPAWLSLARAYYLQARDADAARAAREGLARAAQAPAILRMALAVQLDEAEGRIDEAAERANAIHMLAPERYDATLTAARLAGHVGRIDRFDDLIAQARALRPDWPEVDLLESVIMLRRGDQKAAIASAESAARKALALGWQDIAGEALLNAARAYGQSGQYTLALERVETARKTLVAPNEDLLAQLALVEGTVLSDLGEYDRARQSLAQAEAWFRPNGATFELSSVLDIQRAIAVRRGDRQRAAKLADEQLRLAEASGDRYLAVAFSIRIANAYVESGEVAIANEWFSAAVKRASAINNPQLLASTLNDWAHSAWMAAASAEARAAATRALEVALGSQDWKAASAAAGLAGEIALSNGDARQAAQLLEQALGYARRGDDPLLLADVARGQSELAFACGRVDQAHQRLIEARQALEVVPGGSEESAESNLSRIRLDLVEAELALEGGPPARPDEALQNAERLLAGGGNRELLARITMLRAEQFLRDGKRDLARARLDSLEGLDSRGQNRLDRKRQRLVRALERDDPSMIRGPRPSSCDEAFTQAGGTR